MNDNTRDPPTPADRAGEVSEERLRGVLAEARDFVARHSESWYKSGQELLARIDAEILRSRASREGGRWVPWKPGDALPAHGVYWVTRQRTKPICESDRRPRVTEAECDENLGGKLIWWPSFPSSDPIIAYWSARKPPAYTPAPAKESDDE